MRACKPLVAEAQNPRHSTRPVRCYVFLTNSAAGIMIALSNDWGDPGFVGDYPALSSGTEPSAPGKRAKRTFNKHQHALQQLVSETVVLQPRSSVYRPPESLPAASLLSTGADKQTKDADELKEGVKSNKKRKRNVASAGGSTDSAAKLLQGAAPTAGAKSTSPEPPKKAKRQRNKFKADYGEWVPTIAALNSADVARHRTEHKDPSSSQQKQSDVGGPAGPHTRRANGLTQPSGGKEAKVRRADAKRKGADVTPAVSGRRAAAGAVIKTAQQRSHGQNDPSGAEQSPKDGRDASLTNGSKKRRKADQQGYSQAGDSRAAQEPRQVTSKQHGHQPDASPPTEVAAIGQIREGLVGQATGRQRKEPKAAPVGRASSAKPLTNSEAAEAGRDAQQVRDAAPVDTGEHTAERHGGSARPAAQSAAHKSVRQAGKSTPALDRMRERLQGGRFRWLNEQMYSQPGEQSFRIMQEDPDLYQQYHEGFRQQTAGWPRQPVEVAIEWLRGKPAGWRVADFGCGDARIADTVEQEVHSFDLVSTAPGVVACNMAAVPLDDASVDAAFFCLALMGTDYGLFLQCRIFIHCGAALQEAHRVLRKGGWLWIAEVRSRFAGMVGEDGTTDGGSEGRAAGGGAQQRVDKSSWVNLAFQQAMRQLGFKLVSRDAGNKMFVIMQFRKGGQPPAESIQWPQLKACVYRKR